MSDDTYVDPEELMTDTSDRCLHAACSCVATQGDFCSDHCREHAGRDDHSCGCGHSSCAGAIGQAETAVG